MKRPEPIKPKRAPVYCKECGEECLQNSKTIPKQTVIWCQQCEQQWLLRDDDNRISAKLPEAEAKRLLELRASQIDGWVEMFRNVNNDELWEE